METTIIDDSLYGMVVYDGEVYHVPLSVLNGSIEDFANTMKLIKEHRAAQKHFDELDKAKKEKKLAMEIEADLMGEKMNDATIKVLRKYLEYIKQEIQTAKYVLDIPGCVSSEFYVKELEYLLQKQKEIEADLMSEGAQMFYSNHIDQKDFDELMKEWEEALQEEENYRKQSAGNFNEIERDGIRYWEWDAPPLKPKPPVCECGVSAVVKDAPPHVHSDYCPLYKPKK